MPFRRPCLVCPEPPRGPGQGNALSRSHPPMRQEAPPLRCCGAGFRRPGIKRAPPFRAGVVEVRGFGMHGADYGDRQALQLPYVPHEGPMRGLVAPVRRVQIRVELVRAPTSDRLELQPVKALLRGVERQVQQDEDRAGARMADRGVRRAVGAVVAPVREGLFRVLPVCRKAWIPHRP